jgi:hypothetical protein
MRKTLASLDRILRGDATNLDHLRGGSLELPVARLTLLIALLAAFYGVCMGTNAMLRPDGPEWRQMVASAAKVPALFLLTLAITFPSLYVFSALMGSRLTLPALTRLLVASLCITIAVLASLGPIEAFFALSTTSYDFMVLLNVAICAVAGILGVKFLLHTLHRLAVSLEEPPPPPAAAAVPPPLPPNLPPLPGPLERLPVRRVDDSTRAILRVWLVVYAVVGAQMAWILRPFVGDPGRPFEWFRERDSNFFEAVWRCLLNVLF